LDKNKIKKSIEGFSFTEEIRILYNILTPYKQLKLHHLDDTE
jgi:hypothetical protein